MSSPLPWVFSKVSLYHVFSVPVELTNFFFNPKKKQLSSDGTILRTTTRSGDLAIWLFGDKLRCEGYADGYARDVCKHSDVPIVKSLVEGSEDT